jgi:hypothetical protein
MHLRGGDVIHRAYMIPWYGQPVCNFYLGAMSRDRVVIATEDEQNPCLQTLLDHGAVWNPGSLRKDMNLMLWASRFVLSRSTLMLPVMYLSPVKKLWYMFGGLNIRDPGRDRVWHLYAALGDHWHCLPSHNVQVDVLKNWRPWKAERLLAENCTWFWADPTWFVPAVILNRTLAIWAEQDSG